MFSWHSTLPPPNTCCTKYKSNADYIQVDAAPGGVSRHVKGSTKLLKPCWYMKQVSDIIRARNQMAVPHRWFGSFTFFLIWHITRLVKFIRIYDTTISHWSCSPSVMNLYDHLKWFYANLAHSQNPQHLATPADTYLQISLMVTDIQDITFLVNLQSFSLFSSALCQSQCLVGFLGLLTSGCKTCGHVTVSNYPKPHLTFLVMLF